MHDNYSSFDDFFSGATDIYEFKNHKFKVYKSSDDIISTGVDVVNSPAHYTHGRVEAIEVIEDAIENAPSTTTAFYLGQTLKYLLRLWHKENPKQDAEKARWYLNKLIDKLS